MGESGRRGAARRSGLGFKMSQMPVPFCVLGKFPFISFVKSPTAWNRLLPTQPSVPLLSIILTTH